VGLGGFREDGHESGILIGGVISEQDKSWLLLTENGFNFFLGEFENGWDHEWLDPGGESLLIGSTSVWDDWVLEVSKESDSWSSNLVFLSASGIVNMEELNLIFSVGESNMDISEKRSILSTEVSKDEFGILGLSLEGIAVNFGGWWSRLLGDPLDDGVLGSSTGVFLLFSVFEPEEGWETFDSESLTQFLLLSGINLSKGNWWVGLGKFLSSSGILWSEFFAVTAPWCIEFYKQVLVLGEFRIEVIIGEYEDSLFNLDISGDVLDGADDHC